MSQPWRRAQDGHFEGERNKLAANVPKTPRSANLPRLAQCQGWPRQRKPMGSHPLCFATFVHWSGAAPSVRRDIALRTQGSELPRPGSFGSVAGGRFAGPEGWLPLPCSEPGCTSGLSVIKSGSGEWLGFWSCPGTGCWSWGLSSGSILMEHLALNADGSNVRCRLRRLVRAACRQVMRCLLTGMFIVAGCQRCYPQ